MKYVFPFWQTLTTDVTVLEMIEGVHIPFDTTINHTKIPSSIKCSSSEMQKVDKVLESFVSSSIIEEVDHCEHEFISSIFPVAKKNKADVRIILILKSLNTSDSYQHFKMERLNSALALIEKDCYMASIDLKDAYYSLSVHEPFRKYLRFYWKSRFYQFTCLAQRLSCAPLMFTEIMKPIYAFVRSRGFLSTYYLDDSLLFGRTLATCLTNVKFTTETLENAGFIISINQNHPFFLKEK